MAGQACKATTNKMTDLELAHIIQNNTRVILPQFGAFLQKKDDDGQFNSNNLTFSVFLRHNDNFLETEIARAHGCSIEMASKEVASYIQRMTQNLTQTGRHPIEGLGVLVKEGSQVQFHPHGGEPPLENPLQPEPESRPAPQPSPSQQAPPPLRPAPHPQQRKTQTLTAPSTSWGKRLVATLIFVAISVAIIIGIAYLIRYTVFAPQIVIDRPEPTAQPAPSRTQPLPLDKSSSGDALDQEFEHMGTDNAPPSSPKPQNTEERIEQNLRQSPTPKPPPQPATPTDNEANFYLIVGSFREQPNADKLADELAGKGLPSVVLKRPNDTYVVSLGTYTTREQANEAKQQHAKAFPAAWVMSRPQ